MQALAAQLERGALEFGDTAAMISPDGQPLTYRELRDQTNYVASSLADWGVRCGDRVAILLPHGMELAVCLLGVASYTACIPLDPALKAGELERILTQSEAVALINGVTQFEETVELSSRLGIDLIRLERKTPSIPGKFNLHRSAASSRVEPNLLDADRAVILCTSGSTSRPKLVPQSQEGLVAAAFDLAEWFRLGKTDRCLGCMALFHGNGLFSGLLPVLVSGGSYLSLESFSPDEFFRCLRVHNPTWLTTIPTYLQALLRQAKESKESVTPNQLRFIRVGSAHLPPDTRKAVEDLFSVKVIAGYGSAEVAHITNNPLPPREQKDGSVGLPCGNEVKLVDTDGKTLIHGEVGEILVRGRSVTTGYLGAVEENADLFLNGWLRTGDQGRFDADGYLTLVGRTKQMINRGGESIFPMEVQDVLSTHPMVAGAAVFPVPHPTLGENVAAAVVLHPGRELSQADLQQYLRERLSDQKVPYRIMQLKELPINSIGKVQNTQLAAIFQNMPHNIKPRTPVEEDIARIWGDILGIEGVGVTDHFIDLGGDSISALSVLTKINSRFDITLQLSDVLQVATIEELGNVVAEVQAKAVPQKEHSLNTSIPRRATTEPAPLSLSEFGLWIVQHLDPDNVAYNSPLFIRFTGPLDTLALEESLRALVQRHEILRTTYKTRNDEPVRSVSTEFSYRLEMEDLRSQGDSTRERYREFERLAHEEIRRPFDLSEWPIMRSRLFRTEEETHMLVLNLHHIITDGWSSRLIVRELGALFRATVKKEPVELPELPIQYADYAAWQRSREDLLEPHLLFWRRQLANQPGSLSLPTDRPVPALRSPLGSTVSRRTSGRLGEITEQLSRRLGTTHFVILQAMLKVLLHQYSGETDISIGTSAANRGQMELENLVGCFITRLVLRSDLSGKPTFGELIERERDVCYGAYEHQAVPFAKVIAAIKPKRLPGVNPLFQVVFSLRYPTAINLSGTGVQCERISMHNGTRKYDLTVEVTLREDHELDLWAEYSLDIFDEKTVADLLESYENLIKTIAENPGRSIGDLT